MNIKSGFHIFLGLFLLSLCNAASATADITTRTCTKEPRRIVFTFVDYLKPGLATECSREENGSVDAMMPYKQCNAEMAKLELQGYTCAPDGLYCNSAEDCASACKLQISECKTQAGCSQHACQCSKLCR